MDGLNIYQRLLKITEELATVKKGLTVGEGKNSYKAVGEKEVLQAVKPLEIKYGVYSQPVDREIVMQEIVEQDKGTYKKTLFFMRIKTTYRFVNVDNPDDYTDQISLGDGIDPLDKAPGKAMTYSDKYSLLKAYKIETGDDPDKDHSDDIKIIKKSYVKKPYVAPKKEHSSLGDLTPEAAQKAAVAKGMETINSTLEHVENINYKDEVVKNVCGIYGVKEWKDVTFKTNDDYKKLCSIVNQEIEKEKALAQAGI